MDADTARRRVMAGLTQWATLDSDLVRCVDDGEVDYSDPPRVRVPEGSLFAMGDDESWSPFVDGGSPWLHATLLLTADGSPIVILASQSIKNGRRSPGTYHEVSVNFSFGQRVAELLPRCSSRGL